MDPIPCLYQTGWTICKMDRDNRIHSEINWLKHLKIYTKPIFYLGGRLPVQMLRIHFPTCESFSKFAQHLCFRCITIFLFVIFLIQNYSLKFICQSTLRKQLKFNDIEAEIFCNCMLSAVKINVGTLFQILLVVLDKGLR